MGKLLVSDKKLIKNIEVDIAIGDIVSETTRNLLRVIDGKTRRTISIRKQDIEKEIQGVIEIARSSPYPEPEEALENVFAGGD